MQIIPVNTNPPYAAAVGPGLLRDCGQRLREAVPPCRMAVVTDSVVGPLYLERVAESLKAAGYAVSAYEFPAGEKSKKFGTLSDILEFLARERVTRADCLAALGGGVVGDLTGYAAATYLRGIGFVQMPTTLLSQVDSSIGGKTGVDFDSYKNMVGAFHMPRLVYMSLGALKTLPERQFAAGMAEVIKNGLIQDRAYYEWLNGHRQEIRSGAYEAILSMVYESCRIKKQVVEEDPTEQGIRAWLNFGHTAGHAVEKLKHFEWHHGECVSVGCAAAAWISLRRGLITEEEYEGMEETLRSFGLPVRVADVSPESALEAVRHDKKMEAGKIKFILLKKIGEAFVAPDVEDEEILDAIRHVKEEARNE